MAWDGQTLPVTWQGAPEIMGVLNLTPDSFSDGGELLSSTGALKRDALLRRAEAFVEEGAAYLDLGAESTRPGAQGLPKEEEWARIQEALELLAPRFDVKLSVDTSTPEILRHAPALGAALLNDVRALQRPGALAAALAGRCGRCPGPAGTREALMIGFLLGGTGVEGGGAGPSPSDVPRLVSEPASIANTELASSKSQSMLICGTKIDSPTLLSSSSSSSAGTTAVIVHMETPPPRTTSCSSSRHTRTRFPMASIITACNLSRSSASESVRPRRRTR